MAKALSCTSPRSLDPQGPKDIFAIWTWSNFPWLHRSCEDYCFVLDPFSSHQSIKSSLILRLKEKINRRRDWSTKIEESLNCEIFRKGWKMSQNSQKIISNLIFTRTKHNPWVLFYKKSRIRDLCCYFRVTMNIVRLNFKL